MELAMFAVALVGVGISVSTIALGNLMVGLLCLLANGGLAAYWAIRVLA